MHALILADLGRDWSLAGSVETFAIPVGLFVVVAAVLFYLLSRPHVVPGHRDLAPAGAGTARASAAPADNGGAEAAPTTEDGS
ncbi:MAG: hypothetical protein ACM32E_10740 [Gemmatimonadota bacterium]